MTYYDLSKEQQEFCGYALLGKSVLVDACIGSGKTTAIQILCDLFSRSKSILYLTYNKLLKLDAKARISGYNTDVTNYHGFAYRELVQRGISTPVSECIANYVRAAPMTRHYDVLILDEYQDIDSEIAQMLQHIKNCNPGIQIVAVGDMAQKIYDKTRLDVMRFITGFLPAGYLSMEFTQCFRLGRGHALMLGEIWGKRIVGVNRDFQVEAMSWKDVCAFAARQEPGALLCLGSNDGKRSRLLNYLEDRYPMKFNKDTVWSKISDHAESTSPGEGVAIFTTYDGCKGMERDVCIVFDWDDAYWASRTQKPNARYEIIRNIFCVAASRGKRRIIFVKSNKAFLQKETLMMNTGRYDDFKDVGISGMFDFKFAEDIEDAYKTLDVRRVRGPGDAISVPTSDGLIDLSPCISLFTLAAYFEDYDIDSMIDQYFQLNPDQDYAAIPDRDEMTVEQKILYLVSLETHQKRYWNQVKLPFLPAGKIGDIMARLARELPRDAVAQSESVIGFYDKHGGHAFNATGLITVEHCGCVYDIRFVNELDHTHFLQLASHMIARKYSVGRVWNVRTDEIWEVRIPNEKVLLDKIAICITKGQLPMYYGPDAGGSENVKRKPAQAVWTPGADVIIDLAKSRDVLDELDRIVSGKCTAARRKVLNLCKTQPELAGRAAYTALTGRFRSDKQRAAAVWTVFHDAGIPAMFAVETTFLKHFREYTALLAQGGYKQEP